MNHTITLLGIDGVGNDSDLDRAISYSSKLFPVDYAVKVIKKMTVEQCQEFTIKELNDFVKTDYVITIQADGFILNPDQWDDRFFDYDYIGAPWTIGQNFRYSNAESINCLNDVGNGGFSFRSKRFIVESSMLEYDGHSPEDAFLCIKQFKNLQERGIKFAPSEIASKFSTDPYDGSSFGFHGDRDMINRV